MSALNPPSPLVAVRRRQGLSLLVLALVALLLVVALLIATSPPSLRGGTVMLSLLLSAIVAGTGLLSLLWTWAIGWPRQRQRLSGAQKVRRLNHVPASPDQGRPALALIVGAGCLTGAMLWTLLNAVGLIGAPMLWLVVGAINLETARQVRRVERRERVVYYEVAARPIQGIHGRLYALPMP